MPIYIWPVVCFHSVRSVVESCDNPLGLSQEATPIGICLQNTCRNASTSYQVPWHTVPEKRMKMCYARSVRSVPRSFNDWCHKPEHQVDPGASSRDDCRRFLQKRARVGNLSAFTHLTLLIGRRTIYSTHRGGFRCRSFTPAVPD